jgi:hypothetical protein
MCPQTHHFGMKLDVAKCSEGDQVVIMTHHNGLLREYILQNISGNVEKKNEAEHFTVGTYHLGLQKF